MSETTGIDWEQVPVVKSYLDGYEADLRHGYEREHRHFVKSMMNMAIALISPRHASGVTEERVREIAETRMASTEFDDAWDEQGKAVVHVHNNGVSSLRDAILEELDRMNQHGQSDE